MSDTTTPAFPKLSDFTSNLPPGKWAVLETKVYKLIKITPAYTKYVSSTIGTLLDEEGITRRVWLPNTMIDKIEGGKLPCWILNQGAKQSATDSSRLFYDISVMLSVGG